MTQRKVQKFKVTFRAEDAEFTADDVEDALLNQFPLLDRDDLCVTRYKA